MPRVTVWMVRLSLIHLSLGSTAGAILLAGKGGLHGWMPIALLSAHREVLLFGWIVQFALGVGFWVLPSARAEPIRRRIGVWVAALLNAGVALQIADAALGPPVGAARMLPLTARALVAAAVLLFVAPIIVRPPGRGR